MPVFDNIADLIEHVKAASLILSARGPAGSPSVIPSTVDRDGIGYYDLQIVYSSPGERESQQYVPDVTSLSARDAILIPRTLLSEVNSLLKDEQSDIRRLSSCPIDRSFVYVDLSDFSKLSTGQQLIAINTLVRLVSSSALWSPLPGVPGSDSKYGKKRLEASLCIGDGFIYVLNDEMAAVVFASRLASLIEFVVAHNTSVPIHFRMGVHAGAVNCFWDAGRNDWNFVGQGIIGARRVLEAIGKEVDDVVYVSDEIRRRVMAFGPDITRTPASIIGCLANRGRKRDKHGQYWRVYELNHTSLTPDGVNVADLRQG